MTEIWLRSFCYLTISRGDVYRFLNNYEQHSTKSLEMLARVDFSTTACYTVIYVRFIVFNVFTDLVYQEKDRISYEGIKDHTQLFFLLRN